MALRSADSDNDFFCSNRYKHEHCTSEKRGAYIIVIENCVPSGLYDMIIPPIQRKICMEVPWISPDLSTIFEKEDISQNVFRLERLRKHMRDVEQNRQVLRMVPLFPVFGHVKLIRTLTEAKIMTSLSA